MSRKPIFPRPSIILLALFLAGTLLIPLPYVIIEPGNGKNVMGSLLKISGHKTYATNGKLFLTTVYATSPDSSLFAFDVVRAWLYGETIVVPRDAVYPAHISTQAIDAANTADMVDSQHSATVAALTYLGIPFKTKLTVGKDGKQKRRYIFPFGVSINLPDTGGPSGGLVFALGIVEKLTADDILAGRSVAGTGTISSSGLVGAIGGIDEKLIAARRAGATIFLAPAANCLDIKNIPSGIKVYIVATLSAAISVLKNTDTAHALSVPRCA